MDCLAAVGIFPIAEHLRSNVSRIGCFHLIRLTYIDEAGSAIDDEGKRRSPDGFLPVSKVGDRQLRNDFARRDLVAEVIGIKAIEATSNILALRIHQKRNCRAL